MVRMYGENVWYELTKDLSRLSEGICMLGNMLEFHGECIAVSPNHHTIR